MALTLKFGILCLAAVIVQCAPGRLGSNFHYCPGSPQNSIIKSVTVDGKTDSPSILKKGTTVNLQVNFTSKVDSSKSESAVHGIIGGVPVPFPLPQSNGCMEMTPGCPIKKQTDYSYNTKLEVKSVYPSLKLVVKWEEKGDSGDIFCFEIAAQIES